MHCLTLATTLFTHAKSCSLTIKNACTTKHVTLIVTNTQPTIFASCLSVAKAKQQSKEKKREH